MGNPGSAPTDDEILPDDRRYTGGFLNLFLIARSWAPCRRKPQLEFGPIKYLGKEINVEMFCS